MYHTTTASTPIAVGPLVALYFTIRDGALEIAYKKFTGDFGLDFLGHLRNQVGGPQGPDF